ncbi:Uncharacterised protein [Niallia circulans]|nr:Uncharacterised protein [Niallia circulans]
MVCLVFLSNFFRGRYVFGKWQKHGIKPFFFTPSSVIMMKNGRCDHKITTNDRDFDKLFSLVTEMRKVMIDMKNDMGTHFDQMETRFSEIDKRFDGMKSDMDKRFDEMKEEHVVMNRRIGNLETAQLETNARLSKVEDSQMKTAAALTAIADAIKERTK